MSERAPLAAPTEPLPEPLAAGLKAVDADHAHFANRLHRLLAAAPDLVLERGWHRRDAPGAAFADTTGLLWLPLGCTSDFADDLDLQIDLLTRFEPIIVAFEHATGLAFAPAAMSAAAAGASGWIALALGELRCLFGFRPEATALELAVDSADALPLARTPRRVRLTFRAGTVPLAELEALSRGGLLCLPAAPVAASLALDAGARGLAGTWDHAGGAFAAPRNAGVDSMTQPKPEAAPGGGLAVPVTVRLPETAVPAADIEALAEGGTIAIAPLAEGLAAELLVAGKPVASGEIVRLGDAFAFLVDVILVHPQVPAEDALSPSATVPREEGEAAW